ncbi:Uncharacterized protein dnm_041360 [Desulfonema magnum]|uniref:Uncharacterized protein n=1 Tax=Desulfonema magnum TaxID=45655 RepID=A0A975GNS7_9BACT|nr:Uncharacterized protein dnm_041360 [Desulfonema magnum]
MIFAVPDMPVNAVFVNFQIKIRYHTNSLLKSSIEKVQLSATEQNKAFV